MFKTKLFASILLAVAILFAQVGAVFAAPAVQTTTPIIGTVQTITTEADTNGVTTVLVTLTDSQNATQTVRLSMDTAVTLGLVTLDPNGAPVVDSTKVGQTVEIDPSTVIPDATPTEDEAKHPVAALLAAFFGTDYETVIGYHEDGFGFGVIAQALWMSKTLNGDAAMAEQILDAKRSRDYSSITLPDGSTPTNWVQFRKAVLGKGTKKNLGQVMSGKADPSNDTTQEQLGNGNGHGHGKGNGKGKGRGGK